MNSKNLSRILFIIGIALFSFAFVLDIVLEIVSKQNTANFILAKITDKIISVLFGFCIGAGIFSLRSAKNGKRDKK